MHIFLICFSLLYHIKGDKISILQKIENLDVQFITVIHKNLDKVDEDFVNTNLLPPYVSTLEHSYKVAFFYS